jgi:hypothetical protein
MYTARMDKTTVERILARSVGSADGCVNWTGAKNSAGYGNVFVSGKYRNAHRAMWIATHGDLPRKAVVCHRCDNPGCVNIEHLFLGSQLDNMTDMDAKGRRAVGSSQGAKIAAGWTHQLRLYRAAQTGERMRIARDTKRALAGGDPGTKHCPGCGQWLPTSEFHKNAARLDGLKPYCKPCSISQDGHRRKSNGAAKS